MMDGNKSGVRSKRIPVLLYNKELSKILTIIVFLQYNKSSKEAIFGNYLYGFDYVESHCNLAHIVCFSRSSSLPV